MNVCTRAVSDADSFCETIKRKRARSVGVHKKSPRETLFFTSPVLSPDTTLVT
jgi:hypothetical protein